MGRLDRSFPETAAMLVASRRGFPRYYKAYNSKSGRKSGRFRVTSGVRTTGNQFSDFPAPAVVGATLKHRAD